MTGPSGRGEQARTAGFELKNDCQNSMNVEDQGVEGIPL